MRTTVVKYINEARELGDRGAAAGRERVGLQVHRGRRQARALRARRDPQRRAHARSTRFSPRAPTRPFTSLFDLCERVDLRLCNKRVFEALIAVRRARLARRPSRAVSLGARRARCRRRGSSRTRRRADRARSSALASADDGAAPAARAHAPQHFAVERQRAARRRRRRSSASTSPGIRSSRSAPRSSSSPRTACRSSARGWTTPMALGVVVTAIKRQVSKRSGSEFARLTVEDFSGSSEVLVFPEAWALLGDRIKTDVPVLLKGGYSQARPGGGQSDVHRRVGHAVRGAARHGQRRGVDRARRRRAGDGRRDARRARDGRRARRLGAARAAVERWQWHAARGCARAR